MREAVNSPPPWLVHILSKTLSYWVRASRQYRASRTIPVRPGALSGPKNSMKLVFFNIVRLLGRLGASWGRLGHLGGLLTLSWARLGFQNLT